MSTELKPDGPTRVVGELPARTSSTANKDDFTCVWGFQQRYTGNSQTEIYGQTGNKRITEGIGPDQFSSNIAPYDRVASNPVGNPVTPRGSTAAEQQFTLRTYAGNTDTVNQPYQHFIDRFESDSIQTVPDEPNNPYEEFLTDLGR